MVSVLLPSESALFQIHAVPLKFDSLGAQPQTLLYALFARQEDSAIRAEDSMPRQWTLRRSQRPDDLAGRSRKPGGLGDSAIGRHFAFRYTPDRLPDLFKHDRCYLPAGAPSFFSSSAVSAWTSILWPPRLLPPARPIAESITVIPRASFASSFAP